MWYSSGSFDGKNDDQNMDEVDDVFDDFVVEKQELQPQGVDPRRGWGFRGVHKVFDIEILLRNSQLLFGYSTDCVLYSTGQDQCFDITHGHCRKLIRTNDCVG